MCSQAGDTAAHPRCHRPGLVVQGSALRVHALEKFRRSRVVGFSFRVATIRLVTAITRSARYR